MAYGIAADSSGNAYLAGYTESASLPWISGGAVQPTFGGGTDGFVIKIDSSGANVWATYLGTSGGDGLGRSVSTAPAMSGSAAPPIRARGPASMEARRSRRTPATATRYHHGAQRRRNRDQLLDVPRRQRLRRPPGPRARFVGQRLRERHDALDLVPRRDRQLDSAVECRQLRHLRGEAEPDLDVDHVGDVPRRNRLRREPGHRRRQLGQRVRRRDDELDGLPGVERDSIHVRRRRRATRSP